MGWNRCNCATTLDHLLSLYNNPYLSLPFPLACGSKPICGKERTLKEPFFSGRSSFTYIPLPILHNFSLSPSLSGFLFGDHGEGFLFFRGGGVAVAILAGLTLLWEESRFFWHQWAAGRDRGWCGIARGIDRRRLLWMATFCSAVLCPTAGLHLQPQQARLSHLLPLRRLLHVRPHAQSQHDCLGLCRKRSKCVGIMLVLHQGSLVVVFAVTETYCRPVCLTRSDLNLSWCFCSVSWEHSPAVDCFKTDSCSCTVAKGKEWSTRQPRS